MKLRTHLIALLIACFTREVRAQEVQKNSTPISQTKLIDVLRTSHIEQTGRQPNRSRLAMAWAHIALENDRGNIVWNHNLGNISPGTGHAYYHHTPRVRYRSYDSFVDGAKAYWWVMNGCQPVLRMFDSGQPELVAEHLKKCKYYQADIETYSHGLMLWYHYALKTVIPGEERERQEREETNRIDRERAELERRTIFSPKCGCCSVD